MDTQPQSSFFDNVSIYFDQAGIRYSCDANEDEVKKELIEVRK